MPVVIRSFRSGSASITARGKRRALAHGDDDGEALKRGDDLVGPPRCSLKTLTSTSPLTLDQSAS